MSASFRLMALCGALGLTALGCGSDDPKPETDSDSDSVVEEDSAPTTGKVDAGKGGTSTPPKRDAAVTTDKPDDGDDTQGGNDAGTKPPASANKSLWCDALTVFEETCQSCHGATTAAGAPMSLVTYADLIAAAPVTKGKKTYEVVSTRIHDTKNPMPPGKPLSAARMDAIDAWIADGAKAGDDEECAGKTVPAPTTQVWPPAGCTETYKITAGNGKRVNVAANSETHPQVILDAPWGDATVQGIAFRPITDNAKILHHWILNANAGAAAFINGWAPGQDDSERAALPMDVGIYLPKGKQSLRLDMHYNNLQGPAATDDSGLEICVTRELRKNNATTFSGFAAIPIIPPGAETDMVGTCNVVVKQPVFLLSESPHAHKLATHMKLTHKRGSVVTSLHDAPFAFDGQTSTPLEKPFELKTGDVITTTCHFKNDTTRTVTFGEDTGNEMCFNFASYYPMGALSCSGAGGFGGLFGGT